MTGRLLNTGKRVIMAAIFVLAPAYTGQAQDSLRLPIRDAGVFDPSQGPLKVEFDLLKDAEEVQVLVKDFRGLVIERLNFDSLRAGKHSFSWKGKDENGEKMPDGRYRFEIIPEFLDGTTEMDTVEVRIITIPEEKALPAPEPLGPREYRYKLEGEASTFWRGNREDPDREVEEGEHRVRTHFLYQRGNSKIDGVFSLRRPFPDGEGIYDGSWAMAEQTWKGGRVKGVFRQGLGRFRDPMRLFSDFRTEREKVGVRLWQSYRWLNLTALTFRAEGDVDSREKGLAGRLTFGPAQQRWQLGINFTGKRDVAFNKDHPGTNSAVSGDTRIPLEENLDLLIEYAVTKNHREERDEGYLIKADYAKEGLRVSGGYVNLGEEFEAAFSDPLRHVRKDAHGFQLDGDFFSRKKLLGIVEGLSISSGIMALKRHTSEERLYDGNMSLRFNIGKRDAVFLNWFLRDEEAYRTSSIMGQITHKWNDAWTSRLQANFTGTKRSHTWRCRKDLVLREGKNSYRVILERSRRVIEGLQRSPYEETGLRLDIKRGPWRFYLAARRNRRDSDSATNFFGRVEYVTGFLHRYNLSTYVSVGNRAGFKTEEQLEAGVQLSF